MSDGNGEPRKDTIILTLTREPWQMEISGEVENMNLMMAMLQEATRTVEMQWRIEAAKEHQKMQQEATLENARVQSILRKTKIRQ